MKILSFYTLGTDIQNQQSYVIIQIFAHKKYPEKAAKDIDIRLLKPQKSRGRRRKQLTD